MAFDFLISLPNAESEKDFISSYRMQLAGSAEKRLFGPQVSFPHFEIHNSCHLDKIFSDNTFYYLSKIFLFDILFLFIFVSQRNPSFLNYVIFELLF